MAALERLKANDPQAWKERAEEIERDRVVVSESLPTVYYPFSTYSLPLPYPFPCFPGPSLPPHTPSLTLHTPSSTLPTHSLALSTPSMPLSTLLPYPLLKVFIWTIQ